MTGVTVIIPTRDEQIHIERCLRSVEWAAARFVVDAGSGDETTTIARRLEAEVVVHEWEGYSQQKNWALDSLPIETDWVLFLDADEVVTPELANEITECVTNGGAEGYFVSRALSFMGHPLRHAWWYPDRVLRLFLRDHGRFDNRSVHERVVLRGRVATLKNDLIHENLKSLHHFIDRHNRYSTLEANEILAYRRGTRASELRPSLRGDSAQRRRALKERVWWRMPLFTRPVARFAYMYFWRKGFLDGLEGLIFTLLIATYEFQIDAKLVELTRREVHQSS